MSNDIVKFGNNRVVNTKDFIRAVYNEELDKTIVDFTDFTSSLPGNQIDKVYSDLTEQPRREQAEHVMKILTMIKTFGTF